VITGTAVEQGSEYGGRSANHKGGIAGDETEDLFELLCTVKVSKKKSLLDIIRVDRNLLGFSIITLM
jgi:diphthine-ammonia ligase